MCGLNHAGQDPSMKTIEIRKNYSTIKGSAMGTTCSLIDEVAGWHLLQSRASLDSPSPCMHDEPNIYNHTTQLLIYPADEMYIYTCRQLVSVLVVVTTYSVSPLVPSSRLRSSALTSQNFWDSWCMHACNSWQL